jgi:hypothetical protein
MSWCHKLIDNKNSIEVARREIRAPDRLPKGRQKITPRRSFKNFEAVALAGGGKVQETCKPGMNRTGMKKESAFSINSSKSDAR